MRTSTLAAASALSSIALFPSRQFSDNVRDAGTTQSGSDLSSLSREASFLLNAP